MPRSDAQRPARRRYLERQRLARLGSLGTLATSCQQREFEWLIREVFDLRFPRVAAHKYEAPRTYDVLGHQLSLKTRLRLTKRAQSIDTLRERHTH